MRLLSDLLNLLSPRYCAVCHETLTPSERLVCGRCLLGLPYTRIKDLVENEVTRLFYGRFPIERGYSHLYYGKDAPSHPLLMQLKYGHRPDIGSSMGLLIGQQLRGKGFFEGVDAIVAVPLHWRRQLKRGYNQSAQLAKGLSRATGIRVGKGIVRRGVNNVSQTRMTSGSQRRDNVQGVFVARKTPLRHLLLVDDVLTTGATISVCAEAIMRENPDARFSVLTLAKAK
ncbi:MAG: ComF family protein [Prevotellaceae bacterium]|nr:ComF family protein [Prevotellaceae bacterium]